MILKQNGSEHASKASLANPKGKSDMSKPKIPKSKVPVVTQNLYGAQNQKKLPDIKEINKILKMQKQQFIDLKQAEQNHMNLVASYQPENPQNPQDDSDNV